MNPESHPQDDERYLSVLDASALLATLQNEPGSDIVDAAAHRSAVSSVNSSEVSKKLIEKGMPPDTAQATLLSLGIRILPFDMELGFLAASLFPVTKTAGLSFADRACLALGIKLNLPVLTAERAWGALQLPIQVKVIR